MKRILFVYCGALVIGALTQRFIFGPVTEAKWLGCQIVALLMAVSLGFGTLRDEMRALRDERRP